MVRKGLERSKYGVIRYKSRTSDPEKEDPLICSEPKYRRSRICGSEMDSLLIQSSKEREVEGSRMLEEGRGMD
jgi:hypothetical protein